MFVTDLEYYTIDNIIETIARVDSPMDSTWLVVGPYVSPGWVFTSL